jgi:hypothetical protein
VRGCVYFPNSSGLDVETMRKLERFPGLVDLLMAYCLAAFPFISGLSECSVASGDCSPKSCLGGEQDALESLDDSVDLLGRYTQCNPRVRQYLQFLRPSHFCLRVLHMLQAFDALFRLSEATLMLGIFNPKARIVSLYQEKTEY